MKHRIEHLPPGEELMDDVTFSDLYSRTAPPRPRKTGKARPRPKTLDLVSELGARQLPPPAHAPPARSEPRRIADPLPPGVEPISPRTPAAAAALEGEIGRCRDRESVAKLGLHLARTYAASAALFLAHRGMIQTLAGNGVDDRGAGLLFPAGPGSVFARVAATCAPYRGAPRLGPFDERILRVLGRQHVREMVVLPVKLRGRTVNVLYADNGPQTLGDASVAALETVCCHIARAYERIILHKKQA